ncbi:fasciclin domain-containing protein [Methanohalophilus sp. RSK]|uniref:fasciclin domain-containing protein n=1 Tax=Methanohalophilus sp. RSK TaxID=2485783 RepID=UPI000F439384|nr:fasciclin domain-containing protein [Methanohalophilus sp. RSK]RNI13004.1 fasciclin domain-containing protein [Methanohalophilus sp. RSK]
MEPKDLIQTAKDMGEFSTLLKAAKALGLTEKYSTEGPYTIFAPVESAFEPIPDSVIDDAFEDPDYLRDIISYHIVEGKYSSEDLHKQDALTTIGGNKLRLRENDGKIFVENTPILKPDIECSNGVIHSIGDILVP